MKTPFEIIRDKQQNKEHTEEEIRYMVDKFTAGSIPDYQMSAWLMAVYFNGMSMPEVAHYTRAMVESGERLDFSHLPGFVVDKHSTGGVGDKVSLILGPLMAADGLYVPMLSGRGLGHTGGTLDKLESIPGYQTALSLGEFSRIVEETGISIMGQTKDICPADKKIYALRDVTATVASLPLICGSIMSKKIAEGIQGLVLDVKCGNGAFMTRLEDARKLGELLKNIGKEYGLKVAPVITDMNQPLGNAVGIWCEVQESLELLKDNGPCDLKEVTLVLAEEAFRLAGKTGDIRGELETLLSSGAAYEKFLQMVKAHGGDVEKLQSPKTHTPKYRQDFQAEKSGYIGAIDTFKVGMSIIEMGGGRMKQSDKIDNSTGIVFNRKTGDTVSSGDVILSAFCNDGSALNRAMVSLKSSVTISESPPEPRQLILSD